MFRVGNQPACDRYAESMGEARCPSKSMRSIMSARPCVWGGPILSGGSTTSGASVDASRRVPGHRPGRGGGGDDVISAAMWQITGATSGARVIIPSMTRSIRSALGTAALVPAVLALAACGSTSSGVATGSSPTKNVSSSPVSNTTGDPATGDKATVTKVGFGQQDEFVWASALVKNETDNSGQTVTVHFNLKNSKGKVVASGDQVSAFNWGGQEVPIATQISAPKHVEIASVDATVDVEDNGIGETSDDWGTFKGTLFQQYGQWQARFTVKNPTDKPLKSSALQVICVNAKGDIIGGDAEFPELIPASGVSIVESLNTYVNEKPASCTGYLTPWF
jgi:hypothetical protein